MWAPQFWDSGNSHLHSPTDQVRQMTPTHQSHTVTWSEPHASQYSQLQFYTQHLTLTILQQINIISRVAFHDSDSLVVRQQQTVFQRQQSPSAHWHFINQIMFLTTIRHDQLFSRLSLWVRQSLNRRWTDSTLSDWLPASVCVSAHQPPHRGERTCRPYLCPRQLNVETVIPVEFPTHIHGRPIRFPAHLCPVQPSTHTTCWLNRHR